MPEINELTTEELRLKLLEAQDRLAELEKENAELRRIQAQRSGAGDHRFRTLVEQAREGISLVDEQGTVIIWNPAASRITGLAAEDVLGRSIWDVQIQLMPAEQRSPEVFESLKTTLINFLRTGKAAWADRSMEREYLHLNGSRTIVEGRVYAINTGKGYMLASVSQDISERKRAEELARSTLDGLSAHIAIIDQDGKILAVNQAWRDFAKANNGESGKVNEGANYLSACDHANGMNSGEGKPFANGIRAVLYGPLDKFEMEYPCHSKDRERWFVGRVTRFPLSGPPRVVIAHEDVSERKLGEQALRRAHAELTSLLDISQTVVSTLDLDLLLNLILEKLASVIHYSGAAIVPLEKNILTVQAYRGPALLINPKDIRISISRFGEMRRLILRRQPFFIRDLNDQPQMMAEIDTALGKPGPVLGQFCSWLAVPLVVKDIQIGMMVLIHRKPNYYHRSARNMVQMFANHAAIAIQNAQLYSKAQASAVLEERNRLARELHDSVAQALYSLSLYANATRKALNANKMDVVDSHLRELQRSSSEAVADMRLLIYELRPPVLDEEGLVEAIRIRLESVEARSGIQVSLQVDGEPQLSKTIETEVYRVIQEALNNILKHAQATLVEVKLSSDPNHFKIAIQDNGKGFDPSALERGGGLGFRNIRERIQGIGGVFHIDTAPGQGTSIFILVKTKSK